MPGNWGFSPLWVSMSYPTITTWPSQFKAAFEVQLTVISIWTWQSTSPLSSTYQKHRCLPPAVAQILESRTRPTVVLIFALSPFFCFCAVTETVLRLSFVSEELYTLLLFCEQQARTLGDSSPDWHEFMYGYSDFPEDYQYSKSFAWPFDISSSTPLNEKLSLDQNVPLDIKGPQN